MPRFDDFADDIWALLHVASDEKEGGAHIVLREDFKQTKSVRIVGSVVIGQRKLLGSMRQPGEGATVPLPGGRHRLIASRERGRRNRSCSSEQRCGHGGIVTNGVISSCN